MQSEHKVFLFKTDFLLQTPVPSPRKELHPKPQPDPKPRSSPQTERLQTERLQMLGLVEEALERSLMKSPTRRDSYSDSTDNDELEEAFNQARDHDVYQTPMERLDPYENANLDDTVRSAYYLPAQSTSRPEVNRRSVNPS